MLYWQFKMIFFKLKWSFEDQKINFLINFCVFNTFSDSQDEKIIRSRRDKSLVKTGKKFCQDEMVGISGYK